MARRTTASQLDGAELWERGHVDPESPGPRGQGVSAAAPVMVAGWEDADSFCGAVCANDSGLAFCRACPETVVAGVLASGRPRRAMCRAGVTLLGFPAPRGSRRQVGVLRVAPPTPRLASAVADDVRLPPATLRRAARAAESREPAATLAAARRLRDPEGLTAWRLTVRERAADRRRTTTAALAQMIVTSEEYLRLYQASRRQVNEIERQRRRVDDLARATTTSATLERARIAHRIHDTAAQSMVSAFRYLEAVRATAPPDEALRGRLDEVSERMSFAIREVRAVLNDLIPPGLDELGLAAALGARLEQMAADAGAVGVCTGTLPRLVPEVERALHGMALEAVTNAVRHGRPSSIRVDLRVVGRRAVVEIADDGVGFDPALAARARRAGGGLGLLGLTRQAGWLGGRCTIRSRPGSGTRVRISIPIDRALAPVGQVARERDARPEVPSR